MSTSAMETMELWCGEYGTGSMFSVKIAHDANVGELRRAIYDEQRYEAFPPSELTLYLARKRGVWLKQDHTTEKFLQGEVNTEFEKLLGPEFTPETRDIHVLVELPKKQEADELMELQVFLLRHVLLDAPSSTSARSTDFKANLCAAYACKTKKGKIVCMLLGKALPSALVIASHLFRRSHEFLSTRLMGISDIDDVRNGLLLFKPLEHALHHFQISFIYDSDSDEFRMKIFDRSIRATPLVGMLDHNQRSTLLPSTMGTSNIAPGTNFNIQTTFGDLDGRPLTFKTAARSFKRCLNLQARLARVKAIEQRWIQPDEDRFDDFWSEGMTLAQKMDFFSERLVQ